MSGEETYRLWSINAGKFLVLTVKDNEVKTVTCKGEQDNRRDRDHPGESSFVKLKLVPCGHEAICWGIVFTLNKKEYALHVDDNNTVTALESQAPYENATRLVPRDSFTYQPFIAWEVESSKKYITVNEKGRLSVEKIEESDITRRRLDITFVKI